MAFDKLSGSDPLVKQLLNVANGNNTQDVALPSWVIFPQQHRVEWLNVIVKRLWPHMDKAISATIVASLNPIFESVKPSFIQKMAFRAFQFGEIPPCFTGVEVVTTDDSEIILDISFRWKGDPLIEFAITMANVGSVPFDLPIALTELVIVGVLRIQLKPLIDVLPCFANLGVSFVGRPVVDFNLKTLHLFDLMSVPGLSSFLEDFLKVGLSSNVVWPKKTVIPMLSVEQLASLNINSEEEGPELALTVKIVEAKKLPKGSILSGKTDPFCKIWVNDDTKSSTKVIRNSYNPQWNESFTFFLHGGLSSNKLTITMLDKNIGKDEQIGKVVVPLSSLESIVSGTEDLRTVEIVNGKGTTLTFVLTWRQFISDKKISGSDDVAASSTSSSSITIATTTTNSDSNEQVQKEQEEKQQGPLAGNQEGQEKEKEREKDSLATNSNNNNSSSTVSEGVVTGSTRGIDVGGSDSGGGGTERNSFANFVGRGSSFAASVASMPIDMLGTLANTAANTITGNGDDELNVSSNITTEGGAKGYLKVTVISGKDLQPMDISGFSDPFVRVRVGKVKMNTKYLKSLNPTWNETFEFQINDIKSESIVVKCFDHNVLQSDKEMGEFVIPLAEIQQAGGRVRKEYVLQNIPKGSILLEILLRAY